jgi:hypothetical protein
MLIACNSNSEKATKLNEFLITEGISLTCDMDELAQSSEYLDLMTTSESYRQIIDEITSQDYEKPETVYIMEFPHDVLLQMVNELDKINISDDILEKLSHKINSSIFANMINASYGSEMLAATSMITWEKSYIQPDGWTNNTMVLLKYPGEFSSIVSFVQSGNDVITGSSIYIKNNDEDILKLIDNYMNIEYDCYSGDQLQDLLFK